MSDTPPTADMEDPLGLDETEVTLPPEEDPLARVLLRVMDTDPESNVVFGNIPRGEAEEYAAAVTYAEFTGSPVILRYENMKNMAKLAEGERLLDKILGAVKAIGKSASEPKAGFLGRFGGRSSTKIFGAFFTGRSVPATAPPSQLISWTAMMHTRRDVRRASSRDDDHRRLPCGAHIVIAKPQLLAGAVRGRSEPWRIHPSKRISSRGRRARSAREKPGSGRLRSICVNLCLATLGQKRLQRG